MSYALPTRGTGQWVATTVRSRRFGRPQPRHPRPNGVETLRKTRPGPGFDLLIAHIGLRTGRFEVLEPGARLLDQQQLFGFVPGGYAPTSGSMPQG